jgi:hypothetical protein
MLTHLGITHHRREVAQVILVAVTGLQGSWQHLQQQQYV